jgi:hypothetical protein
MYCIYRPTKAIGLTQSFRMAPLGLHVNKKHKQIERNTSTLTKYKQDQATKQT